MKKYGVPQMRQMDRKAIQTRGCILRMLPAPLTGHARFLWLEWMSVRPTLRPKNYFEAVAQEGEAVKQHHAIALAVSSIISAALALPQSTHAQEAPSSNDTLEQIVVTGSRIARAADNAPSPLTTLGAAEQQEH